MLFAPRGKEHIESGEGAKRKKYRTIQAIPRQNRAHMGSHILRIHDQQRPGTSPLRREYRDLNI